MTRKKPLPPVKPKPQATTAQRPVPNEWEQFKTKLGWSLIALCVAIFGMSYLMPYVRDDSDEAKQRLYGSISVFWLFMIYGVTKAFVWTPAPPATQVAAVQAADGGLDAAVAGTAPDSGDSTNDSAKGSSSRRGKRA